MTKEKNKNSENSLTLIISRRRFSVRLLLPSMAMIQLKQLWLWLCSEEQKRTYKTTKLEGISMYLFSEIQEWLNHSSLNQFKKCSIDVFIQQVKEPLQLVLLQALRKI